MCSNCPISQLGVLIAYQNFTRLVINTSDNPYFPMQLYSLLSFVASNLFPLTKVDHFLSSFSDLKGGL